MNKPELRMELIGDTEKAIKSVTKLVEQLTDEESKFLECNSVSYRQLIDVIRNHYK